ncbi:MAG TPA: hypothetical protein VD999_07840 [Vitreimonas sp.]|nr:hypothetical protein [Vitreimonas sp.]
MATKDKEKAVPATQGNQLPATIDLQGDSNIGRETLSAQDMAMPFVSVLQALSPQVKKGANRIEDAEEGDFFNTVSQEVWSGEDGILVIPCAFNRLYVEWADRDSGGGYQGNHTDESILHQCSRNDRGQDVLPNGNIIVLTNYHYCLLIDQDENLLERVVIPFSSTQLKKSRRWNSMMGSIMIPGANGNFNPPMFSHKYLLQTEEESNNKGQWYGVKITNQGMIKNANTYALAKQFAIDVSKGLVKVVPPEAQPDDTENPY